MKKSLVLLFAFAAFTMFAQSEKGVIQSGRWLASGVLCYDSESDEETNSFGTYNNSWNTGKIGLYGGYAFADNQVAGLGIGYESNTQKYEVMPANPGIGSYVDNTNREGTFSISPFYRYYKWCGGDFAFVGTAKLPIGFTNESEESLTDPSNPDQGTTKQEYPTHTSLGVWIVPSFMWMPDDNWSVEIGLGRLGFQSSSASEDDEKYSTFQFSGKIDLFSPSLAVGYYF